MRKSRSARGDIDIDMKSERRVSPGFWPEAEASRGGEGHREEREGEGANEPVALGSVELVEHDLSLSKTDDRDMGQRAVWACLVCTRTEAPA